MANAKKDFARVEKACKADITAEKVTMAAVAISQLDLVSLEHDVISRFVPVESKRTMEMVRGIDMRFSKIQAS